jgi:hypothetical protein
MTDYSKMDGVTVHEAALTDSQKKAFANAETIAKSIVAKLDKLGIKATSKVIMIDAPEYCFFQTTFFTQEKNAKHESEVAYSEMLYASPKDKDELIALAKRILKDTLIMMGVDTSILDA